MVNAAAKRFAKYGTGDKGYQKKDTLLVLYGQNNLCRERLVLRENKKRNSQHLTLVLFLFF